MMEQELLPPKNRLKCDNCPTIVTKFKFLHKLNGGFYCKKCVQDKRKEFRENITRNVLGLTKEQEQEEEKLEKRARHKEYSSRPEVKAHLKEYHRLRWEREKASRPKTITIPKIKGSKIRSKTKQVHLYLTKDESYFIYKKLKTLNWSDDRIKNRIKTMKEYLTNMVQKMRDNKKSDKQINEQFKEEFSKLIEDFQ